MTRLRERAVNGTAQFVSGLLTLVGVVGLLKTSFSDFAASEGVHFIGMTVNPLTNLVHLGAGLVGIAMATRLDRAQRYLAAVGGGGAVFALLEFVLGDSGADIFGRDTNLAIAQLVVAVGALAVWWWARQGSQREPARVA